MTARCWLWIGLALSVGMLAILGIILTQSPVAPFRHVDSSTKIILKGAEGRSGIFDLTGDREIVDAINELKIGHHVTGRCDSDKRLKAILQIDQNVFRIDAGMVGEHYRVIVRDEKDGWWESERLGEALMSRGEFNPIANFRHAWSRK